MSADRVPARQDAGVGKRGGYRVLIPASASSRVIAASGPGSPADASRSAWDAARNDGSVRTSFAAAVMSAAVEAPGRGRGRCRAPRALGVVWLVCAHRDRARSEALVQRRDERPRATVRQTRSTSGTIAASGTYRSTMTCRGTSPSSAGSKSGPVVSTLVASSAARPSTRRSNRSRLVVEHRPERGVDRRVGRRAVTPAARSASIRGPARRHAVLERRSAAAGRRGRGSPAGSATGSRERLTIASSGSGGSPCSAPLVQGLGDERRADHRAGRHRQDRRVRYAQPLGDDHRPEVGLLRDHHVRSPRLGDGQHVGRALTRDPPREAVAEVILLAGDVERQERTALRRQTTIVPGREEAQTGRHDPRGHPWPAREGDVVTGIGSLASDRQQRVEVATPARERAQQPHGRRWSHARAAARALDQP